MMTIQEYAALVREMRLVQVRYFAGERGVVPLAKRLEKRVDEATRDVLEDRKAQTTFLEGS